MRVLMFGWEFPPYNSGGLGPACQGLARALAAQNIELVFVLPKQLGDFREPFRFRFANVLNMKIAEINALLVPYITSQKYALLRSGMSVDGNYAPTLYEEVRRYAYLARAIAEQEEHDVIHAHDWLSFGAGMEAQDVSGKPFVAHIHATEVDRTAGHVNQYIYDREREGMYTANAVATVSDHTKHVVIDHYGIEERKIHVVHNGVLTDGLEYGRSTGPGFRQLKRMGYKVVLFLGRITIMKGPDYFIHAAKKVLEYDSKVIFVMTGSGDMEGEMMDLAASLGIADKVIFTGFLRGAERLQAYRDADLFVMPSVSEPFGLVPLESLLLDTPVLISKQSGVSEVLSHALKADFWDVDDIADKILSVVEHPSLKSELARNGKRQAQSCTWEKAANRCIQIYNCL
ncbi:hypothetical protein A2801_03255 [Candidatus Woesebacteria bacterium RIFCSPHIGHO2_01_FULL_41_10]|uniref:4-alpha-glucanotransferase n=1 Tax=Candidatus Woesebacteria bacterium RIFCSPHIGHO2_01_FULL_41_10 TaxID=1802500 RepID=A0A1F7YST0_9BACT|nr:MAG: hypothetical protein A2801_03255 [Candidatus Woesebacteria bacterium RIFCSPHIGHO2_01_FULL_41_10]